MKFFTSLKGRFLILLSVIGPGLIAANADNDAGGISTLTVAGARYGYQLLFILLVITLSLAVTQEIGVRIGIVTGKGLGGVIREKFGVPSTMFAMSVMMIANFGVTVANLAGVAEAMSLVGVVKYLSVPIVVILLWLILARGNYAKVERVFLALSLIFVVYVITAFDVGADWGAATKALVTPQLSWNLPFLFTMMALIGTTITPWGQFFIQSYVVDKGVHLRNLLYSRFEVFLGALITDGISFFIIVTAANTLFVNHIEVSGAKEAALALEPLAGHLANGLFALGLLNASLLGAFIVPLATAYAVCEAFGFESGIDTSPKQAAFFYWLLGILISVAALFVLIPGLPLFPIILFSQTLNALLLPIILIYVFKIVNDWAIMGKYRNGRFGNLVLGVTIVGLILASVFVLIGPLVGIL